MNVRNRKKCGSFLLVRNFPILHHSGEHVQTLTWPHNQFCLFVCKDLWAQNCLQIFRPLPHGSALYWDCGGLDRSEVCFSVRLDLSRRQNSVVLCTISTWLHSVLFLLVALLSFFLFTLLRSSLTFQRSKKLCCPLYLFQVVLFSQFLHFLGALPKIVNDPRPHDLFICRWW